MGVATVVHSVGNVPKNETIFPLCKAKDRRWNKKDVSLESSVVMRFPISCTSSIALSFHEPPVSVEMRKKMCEFSKVLYLAHLLIAARSAAAPACMAVSCMCESAYVSGIVTSQAKGLPLAQGIKIAPSVCHLAWVLQALWLQEFQLVLLPSRLDHSFDCGADASVHSFDTPDRGRIKYRVDRVDWPRLPRWLTALIALIVNVHTFVSMF